MIQIIHNNKRSGDIFCNKGVCEEARGVTVLLLLSVLILGIALNFLFKALYLIPNKKAGKVKIQH